MKNVEYKTRKVIGLIPADYNPRTIKDKNLKGLEKSVERFGMVQPIILNKRTNNIVGGHQRLHALKNQGVKETTVAEIDISLAEEKALNVALNNPHITGDFTESLETVINDVKLEFPELYDDLNFDLLEEDFEDGKSSTGKPEVEFTDELMESYNYVVLYFDNDIDWQSAVSVLGLTTKKCISAEKYKCGGSRGIGRVIKGSEVLNRII